jgi:hypothetical protein
MRATGDIAPPISVDSPLGLRGQFTAVPAPDGITGARSTSTGRKGHMTEATHRPRFEGRPVELHDDRHPHVGHRGVRRPPASPAVCSPRQVTPLCRWTDFLEPTSWRPISQQSSRNSSRGAVHESRRERGAANSIGGEAYGQ